MSHMERVGVRDLRQRASEILRRVAAGETFEVTDRGRPVALLVTATSVGLDALEREGSLLPAEGDLLSAKPVSLPRGAALPSDLVRQGRDE